MASKQTSGLLVPYPEASGTYTVSILLPILGMIAVGLRIYTRVLQRAPLGVDDWLVLPALASVIGMGVTLIIGIHLKAIAYPTPYIGDWSPEQRVTAINPIVQRMGQVQFAFSLLMILAFGFIKLSTAYFYRRLFITGNALLFDRATRISISIVILWTITYFFGFTFGCGTHFSAMWGSIRDRVYCPAQLHINDSFVVSDLITDVMILCLPLPVIWNLHMSNTRKMLVTGILATGAVSIIAAIVKVMISYQITYAGYSIYVDSDLTLSTILYWSMIEAGLGIIATCLPTLHFLVSKVSLDSIAHNPKTGHSAGPSLDPDGNTLLGSHARMVPDKGHTETFAMRDVDLVKTVGDDGIHVTKQVYQYQSRVKSV